MAKPVYEVAFEGSGTMADPYRPIVEPGSDFALVAFNAGAFNPRITIAKVQVVAGPETVPSEARWSGTRAEGEARWGVTDEHFVKETS